MHPFLFSLINNKWVLKGKVSTGLVAAWTRGAAGPRAGTSAQEGNVQRYKELLITASRESGSPCLQ